MRKKNEGKNGTAWRAGLCLTLSLGLIGLSACAGPQGSSGTLTGESMEEPSGTLSGEDAGGSFSTPNGESTEETSEGIGTGSRENGEKLKVVSTLFPYYDFARQIGGDLIELNMVIPAGMDSHSFEPTPADIRLIESADLLICNGGAMEHWVEQVVDALEDPELKVITMMDYVDVVEEEIVEGMELTGDEHEHVHDEPDEEHADSALDVEDEDGGADEEYTDGRSDSDYADDSPDSEYADGSLDAGHAHGGSDEIEYDEHIWTSPVNAMKITEVIADTFSQMDPEHQEAYAAAKEAYVEKLTVLDQEFRQVVAEGKHDIIIMADKFPLRYFADTYGLRYRAAFTGCSSDTEPSAKTIAFLIDQIREEAFPAVYYLELSSHRVAEIISEETGAEPLLFHSCHNVTRREFEDGITYLELMERNVGNLREGLCR